MLITPSDPKDDDGQVAVPNREEEAVADAAGVGVADVGDVGFHGVNVLADLPGRQGMEVTRPNWWLRPSKELELRSPLLPRTVEPILSCSHFREVEMQDQAEAGPTVES